MCPGSIVSCFGAQLARPLHRDVNGQVEVFERAVHRVRPLIGWRTQNVEDVVVRNQQLHVARVLELSPFLQTFDLGKHRLVHRRHQHFLGVLVVGRDTGHHVGNHEPLEMLLVFQRILDGQNPAPRVPEEVEVLLVEPERLPDLLDFFDEAGRVPQLGRVRLVAVDGAELVVVVVLDAGYREVTVECFKIFAGRAGPAVEEEHFRGRVITNPLGPHAKGPLRRIHRNHLHSTTENIVSARVVQIPFDFLH